MRYPLAGHGTPAARRACWSIAASRASADQVPMPKWTVSMR
jgi:hypothetical protein